MSIELTTDKGCLVKAIFTGRELGDLYKLFRALEKRYVAKENHDDAMGELDLHIDCHVNNMFSTFIHTWLGDPEEKK